MMWLVEVALRRPISVAVMALLMLVLGTLSFALMPIDIFPAINIPVVMLVWSYPGLSAVDTERRVVTLSERAISTTVNDIDQIDRNHCPESADPGLLPPDASNPRSDCADQRGDRGYPGRVCRAAWSRPTLWTYNAANVPVAQINVWSDTLSESQLFDYGANFISSQVVHDSGSRFTRRRSAAWGALSW